MRQPPDGGRDPGRLHSSRTGYCRGLPARNLRHRSVHGMKTCRICSCVHYSGDLGSVCQADENRCGKSTPLVRTNSSTDQQQCNKPHGLFGHAACRILRLAESWVALVPRAAFRLAESLQSVPVLSSAEQADAAWAPLVRLRSPRRPKLLPPRRRLPRQESCRPAAIQFLTPCEKHWA